MSAAISVWVLHTTSYKSSRSKVNSWLLPNSVATLNSDSPALSVTCTVCRSSSLFVNLTLCPTRTTRERG